MILNTYGDSLGNPLFAALYKVGFGALDGNVPSAAQRTAFAVTGAPAVLTALAADYRFVQLTQYPIVFGDYQAGMLAAMDGWLAAKVASGIAVGTTVLDATPTGRDWLTFQATALLAGLNGGSITGTTNVTVYDTNDAAHTLAAAAALAAFWSYSTQYAALLATYRSKRAAIRAAATTAALDAIAIPA